VLAWMLWVRFDHQLERVFVDARAGGVAHRYSTCAPRRRSARLRRMGRPQEGVRRLVPGGFRAEDRLRPPALGTWDLRHDATAAGEALTTGLLPPALVAADADNDWTDGAVVDAHVYAGGPTTTTGSARAARIDGRDLAMRSVTHFLPRSVGFANAFWDRSRARSTTGTATPGSRRSPAASTWSPTS